MAGHRATSHRQISPVHISTRQEDAFDFGATEGEGTSVDYDDDGDLDLYVINSPGGDNALVRGGTDVAMEMIILESDGAAWDL